MTSDTEALSEEEALSEDIDLISDVEVDEETVTPVVATSVAKAYMKVSVGFLVLGLVDLLILAAQRIAPELVVGVAFLSYGRVAPVASGLLLYGWLTIGLLGALFFVVSRSGNVDLEDGARARGALALLAAAYLAGAVAVLMGVTEGRRYLEAPLIADAVTLIALYLASREIRSLAARARASSAAVWFATASVAALPLVHLLGNIPGITGFGSQIQTAFYRSAYIGLWLAPAAVAVVYHLLPTIGGLAPIRGTRLSVLGLWSLGVVWAMSGPAELTFGAGGDWLETIGVIFSIGLFLPILVIATDLSQAMRRSWHNITDRTSLRLLMAGVVLLGVYAVLNLVQALRSGAAVVGFTDWVAAVETVTLLGPFTFILLALFRARRDDASSADSGIWWYRTLLAGLVVLIGTMMLTALQTGFTWAGAANSGEFANTGDGWISVVRPLEGHLIVQLIALAIVVAGLAGLLMSSRGQWREQPLLGIPGDEPDPDLALDEYPTSRLIGRRTGWLVVAAAALTLGLPMLESEPATLYADSRIYDAGAAATGRDIYIQEGCAYCHTQQVRSIVTDVGLGPVSVLGDYAHETPALIGVQRRGPDLFHVRDRLDAETIAAHLADPRVLRPWSTMPTYDYLSSSDLEALAAYLTLGSEQE